jgi:hypothetical protein
VINTPLTTFFAIDLSLTGLTKIDSSDIRQKGNRTSPLDGMGERPLMLGTTTGQSAGNDFAALGNKVS